MNRFIQIFSITSIILLFISCNHNDDEISTQNVIEEIVVTANRNSSDISFINANNNELLESLFIEGSEPMYVVYVKQKDRLYVGDRASNKVHIINPNSRKVIGSINTGNGMFHMWADKKGDRLWVVNDIDNSISAIDLNTNKIIKNINTKGTPHDIFVSEDGSKVFVSVSDINNSNPESILLYNEFSDEPIAIASVGSKIHSHLFYIDQTDKLYVPTESGSMYILNGDNLKFSKIIDFPFGVHGIFTSPDNKQLYLSSTSNKKLYLFNIISEKIEQQIEINNNTPHNIAVNATGTSLYVTHSGTSQNTVSVFSIDSEKKLSFKKSVITGNNPFGITYYNRFL